MSTFTDSVRCSDTTPKFVLSPTVGNAVDQTNGVDALAIIAVANAAAADVATITNASFGQATTLTIPDPGAATANFVLSGGANPTGTEASNAVTINGQAGVITTSALTTAGGSTYTITLTNSKIKTTSVVQVSWMGGTNTVANFTVSSTAATGSSVIVIHNNTASTALNGTIILGFEVT